MTNKANSKHSFLRRNLKGCPEKIKQTAYFSWIRSFIEYGATVWYSYQKYNSDKVERVQHEIIVGIITLINIYIINDIVNIIITKTINTQIV